MGAIHVTDKITKIVGRMTVPGDKSISHRAVMFGALAEGKTTIDHFLNGEDCLRTVDAFQKLGVPIRVEGNRLIVHGRGLFQLKEPDDLLYMGNSGTTARLMLGILAGTNFHTVMAGDRSLNRRPMRRITEPLKRMGAEINGRKGGNYLPISIQGKSLKAIRYELPVASAQVKSALIFAGLAAEGETVLIENSPSRNHTELMVEQFGGQIERIDKEIIVKGNQSLVATAVDVPGDFSSAAFFIALAAMAEQGDLIIERVGLNPTRTGLLDVLQMMNGHFDITEMKGEKEPVGTLRILSSQLVGTTIGGDLIPRLIDELPIIALMATQAEGTTVIKDAGELRVKETDRIHTVVTELKKLGADIEATEDGMVIRGKTKLSGGHVDSHGDHRIGMMLSVAGLLSEGKVTIENHESVQISYPGFFEDLKKLY